jgi:hypothetical protein
MAAPNGVIPHVKYMRTSQYNTMQNTYIQHTYIHTLGNCAGPLVLLSQQKLAGQQDNDDDDENHTPCAPCMAVIHYIDNPDSLIHSLLHHHHSIK